MPENNHHILEARSAEMEEIIGIIPHWITRWGLTGLLFIAILSIAVSSLISYPDTLHMEVLIQAVNQPGKVTVKRTDANQIFDFRIKDGEMVKPGDTLLTHLDKNTGKVYFTTTPMAGKIFISNGTNESNTLDKIIWVVPKSDNTEIKIKYPNKGSGKVKIGQNVKIDLYDYPSQEFGFLEGQISSILPIEVEGEHTATVKLKTKKLITTEQKIIPIMPIMKGEGDILLNEKSIFTRIFGSIFN